MISTVKKTKANEHIDNLEEQLRMAGLVQRDFLPKALPVCDNLKWSTVFMPAEWVSGDIFDVVRIDENHIGFYVADVVGHGMPAALLTIFLKQALAMRQTTRNTYRIFSPAQVMTNLNRQMVDQKLSGHRFITCCYCLLNIKTLELTFSRAGHPYPVLIRKGCQPQTLELKGTLLGIFENPQFDQQTIKLKKGDKLILYSDGVEKLVGKFSQNDSDFRFTAAFRRITENDIDTVGKKLSAKAAKVQAEDNDDITILGLEIV
ncbi:MAG: PP2C family protein-serine/threonine phosphatase [Phycisphaerae bacterium]|nr:PP2C family protein-serine/threonine phosphatase [Phycisphaerae bacterium]